jgi:hypothetical protein
MKASFVDTTQFAPTAEANLLGPIVPDDDDDKDDDDD